MTPDDLVSVISKFSLRRFEHPGRLAIRTTLTSVNLKSGCMRYQRELLTGRRFDLVRDLRLDQLLRRSEREHAQQCSNLGNP